MRGTVTSVRDIVNGDDIKHRAIVEFNFKDRLFKIEHNVGRIEITGPNPTYAVGTSVPLLVPPEAPETAVVDQGIFNFWRPISLLSFGLFALHLLFHLMRRKKRSPCYRWPPERPIRS